MVRLPDAQFLPKYPRLQYFAADANRHGMRFYRIMNEIPTVLMIAIVLLVVLKPF